MWFRNKQSNEETAIKHYDEGVKHQDNGNHDRAIASFTLAIELKPDYEDAYFQRARSFASKRQYDNVIADCSKAISIDNRSGGSYVIRGITYIQTGLYEKAIADFSAAVSLKSNLSFAYSQRAKCYAKLERRDEAVADYTKALEMEPDNNDARVLRGKEYCLLGLHREAIADLSLVIKEQPSNKIALSFRGLAYVLAADNDKALPDLGKACDWGDKEACALLKSILTKNNPLSIKSDNPNTVTLGSLELFNMPSIDNNEAEKFTKHLFPHYHFDYEGIIRPKSILFYSLKYAYPRHSFGHAYLLSIDIDSFVAECSSNGLSNSSDVFKKYVVGHIEVEYGGDLKSTTFQYKPMKL